MIYLKIFFGKMIDVTLNTMVTIYVVRNKKVFATIIGFFDMFIWLIVINVALKETSNNILIALIYSLGYSVGTYLGTFLTNISKNNINIQIITKRDDKIIRLLKKRKNKTIIVKCNDINKDNNKYIIYTSINHKTLKELQKEILNFDENAFFIINK